MQDNAAEKVFEGQKSFSGPLVSGKQSDVQGNEEKKRKEKEEEQ